MNKIIPLDTKIKNSEAHQEAIDSLNDADAYILLAKNKTIGRMIQTVVGMNKGSAVYLLELAKLELLKSDFETIEV